jgi:hypothetical protein
MENAKAIRVSNWTLATGTQPGERHVYPAAHRDAAPAPAPERHGG